MELDSFRHLRPESANATALQAGIRGSAGVGIGSHCEDYKPARRGCGSPSNYARTANIISPAFSRWRRSDPPNCTFENPKLSRNGPWPLPIAPISRDAPDPANPVAPTRPKNAIVPRLPAAVSPSHPTLREKGSRIAPRKTPSTPNGSSKYVRVMVLKSAYRIVSVTVRA